jgi:hypothetical protein
VLQGVLEHREVDDAGFGLREGLAEQGAAHQGLVVEILGDPGALVEDPAALLDPDVVVVRHVEEREGPLGRVVGVAHQREGVAGRHP